MADFSFDRINSADDFNIKTFNDTFDSIKTYVNTLRADIDSNDTNISTINGQITSINTSISALQNKTSQLSNDGATYSGTANKATNADISILNDTSNGDKLQIGSGTSVNITNAKNAVNATYTANLGNSSASYNYSSLSTALSGKASTSAFTGASINGKTITLTRASGNNAVTLTTQDTVYTHPSVNHIPTGGSSGQFLKWSGSGTAKWVSGVMQYTEGSFERQPANPNQYSTCPWDTSEEYITNRLTPFGGKVLGINNINLYPAFNTNGATSWNFTSIGKGYKLADSGDYIDIWTSYKLEGGGSLVTPTLIFSYNMTFYS